jgi:tetratricopeptide (TPR) repeat protein
MKKLYMQAIDYFNKAIELNPSFAAAYANRSELYCTLGKQDQYKADIDKACTIDKKILYFTWNVQSLH